MSYLDDDHGKITNLPGLTFDRVSRVTESLTQLFAEVSRTQELFAELYRAQERLLGLFDAVPGTHAAECRKPLKHVEPDCGCDRADVVQCRGEREPWTGDGSEEPPAHVKTVVDQDGDELTRVEPDEDGDCWRRTKYAGGGRLPENNIGWTGTLYGPYTEVLPE